MEHIYRYALTTKQTQDIIGLTSIGLLLAHCLRRCTNIKPTLVQRIVSAGYGPLNRNPASMFCDYRIQCYNKHAEWTCGDSMLVQRRRRWQAMWHYGANASLNRRSRLDSFLTFFISRLHIGF